MNAKEWQELLKESENILRDEDFALKDAEEDILVEAVKKVMEDKQYESNQHEKEINSFYEKVNKVARYFEDPTIVIEKVYDFLEKIRPSNKENNKIDKKNIDKKNAFYEKINQVARYFENPTLLFDALSNFLAKIKRMKAKMKPNLSSMDIENQKEDEDER